MEKYLIIIGPIKLATINAKRATFYYLVIDAINNDLGSPSPSPSEQSRKTYLDVARRYLLQNIHDTVMMDAKH